MDTIIKPDQWGDYYAAEKQMDPSAPIVLKSFQRKMVDAVDHIIELAHGQRDFVTSESDWKVVEELIVFFAREWPSEWEEFKAAMPDIKQLKGSGYSESKEMFHLGSVPPRLMKMVKAIFPAQQWDKKFANKLVKRFPLFKVGQA